jgi:hypothetical protein
MITRRTWLGASAGLCIAALGLVALADPPKNGYAPDPTPAPASKKQWVFEVVAKDGKISIDKAKAGDAASPTPTPRVVGRFAIELGVGATLLDRVRFNVPLMGDEPPEKSPSRPFPRPGFDHVSTRLRVQMADSPRAAWVDVIDRMTGDAHRFHWPPESDGHLEPFKTTFAPASAWPPPSAAPADAGPADASADASNDGGSAPSPKLPLDAGPG